MRTEADPIDWCLTGREPKPPQPPHWYYYRPYDQHGTIERDVTTESTRPRPDGYGWETPRTVMAGRLMRMPAGDSEAARLLAAAGYERVTRKQAIRSGLFRPADLEAVRMMDADSMDTVRELKRSEMELNGKYDDDPRTEAMPPIVRAADVDGGP